MIRKWFQSVILLFAPLYAFALGVGPLEIRSALNQTLNAEFELLSVKPAELAELSVRLAAPQVFAQAGIERSAQLTDLEFTVQANANGRNFIKVTSRQPVREPLLNFLVELEWPRGRLVREFTVLLDLPIFMTQAPASPAVSLGHPLAPQQDLSSQLPKTAHPTVYRGGERYGPVAAGQTLSEIASRVRPDRSTSLRQMMTALLKANPDAFVQADINRLNAGAILRIPTAEEIAAYNPPEASQELSSQGDEPNGSVFTASAAKLVPDAVEPVYPQVEAVQIPRSELEKEEELTPDGGPVLEITAQPVVVKGDAPGPMGLEDDHPQLQIALPAATNPGITEVSQSEEAGLSAPSIAPAPSASLPTDPSVLPSTQEPGFVEAEPAVLQDPLRMALLGFGLLLAMAVPVLLIQRSRKTNGLEGEAAPRPGPVAQDQPQVGTDAGSSSHPEVPQAAEIRHSSLKDESDPLGEPVVQRGREPCPEPTGDAAEPALAVTATQDETAIADLYQEQTMETVDVDDLPIDFDFNDSADFPKAEESTTSAAEHDSLDMIDNLDWQLPEMEISLDEPLAEDLAEKKDLETELQSLDFEFNAVSEQDFVSAAPLPDRREDKNFLAMDGGVETKRQEDDDLEARLRNLDFEFDEPALDLGAKDSEPVGDLTQGDASFAADDYIETKLDLAMAYLDMEDPVGAYSLLGEVVQEGNAGQRQRAEELLRKRVA